MPSHGTVGGKHGGCIGTRSRVNETTTDSGAGEAISADGIHFPGPPHRPALAARGVPAYASGRGHGRGRTNGRGLRSEPAGTTCSRCWTGPSPARTGHRRCDGCIFRKGRVATPGRSASRRSKTRSFNGRSSWCWKPSMSRTFWTARTVSGPDGRRTRRWTLCGSRRWRCGGGWIVEVDIRKFFDTLDHAHLRELASAAGT